MKLANIVTISTLLASTYVSINAEKINPGQSSGDGVASAERKATKIELASEARKDGVKARREMAEVFGPGLGQMEAPNEVPDEEYEEDFDFEEEFQDVSQAGMDGSMLRGGKRCYWKGSSYREYDWAYDCGARYDKCQCKCSGSGCKWKNCRDDWDYCHDEGHCDDCEWNGNCYDDGDWRGNKKCECDWRGNCDWTTDCDGCDWNGDCYDHGDWRGNKKCECDWRGRNCDWTSGGGGGGGWEWDKNYDYACRVRGSDTGDQGKDYRKYSGKSKSWCKNKCEDDHNCKGFEYSDDRCEIWWKWYGNVEHKRGHDCYWKVSKSGGEW